MVGEAAGAEHAKLGRKEPVAPGIVRPERLVDDDAHRQPQQHPGQQPPPAAHQEGRQRVERHLHGQRPRRRDGVVGEQKGRLVPEIGREHEARLGWPHEQHHVRADQEHARHQHQGSRVPGQVALQQRVDERRPAGQHRRNQRQQHNRPVGRQQPERAVEIEAADIGVTLVEHQRHVEAADQEEALHRRRAVDQLEPPLHVVDEQHGQREQAAEHPHGRHQSRRRPQAQ